MSSKIATYKMPIVNPATLDADAFEPVQSTAENTGLSLEVISTSQWDEVATLFDDIIPEQTGTFNLSHWGLENIECVKILSQGKIIGGAALIVRKLPLTGTGLAILKWGPLWRLKGEEPVEANYNAVISAITAEYCTQRNLHLTIMPMAVPFAADRACENLRSLGFSTGRMLAAPEKYIVNTHQSTDELMASLNQKWRYNLRKARKNEFDIRFANGEEGLEAFLALYGKMMQRKQFLDASAISSLRDFMQCDVKAIRPRIVLASHDGEITAGGVFSMYGSMASYMFGATDNRALRLKAGYAMHWWVAEHLCNQQHTHWYDLGGNDLDAGLHQFKKGFVGKSGHILKAPPRYHYANSPLARLAGGTVFQLRDTRAAAKRVFHAMKQKVLK